VVVFILGFALGMAGFAMLVVGSFAVPGERRLAARPSRWAGLVFVSFFPLVLGARYLLLQLEWLDAVNVQVVYAALLLACMLGGGTIVFKALPKGQQRRTRRPAVTGFAAASAPAQETNVAPSLPAPALKPTKAAPRTSRPRPEEEKNPFDFS